MTNDEIKQAIMDNKLEYVTSLAVNNYDYDKMSLIIALATGRIATSENIYNLIKSYQG